MPQAARREELIVAIVQDQAQVVLAVNKHGVRLSSARVPQNSDAEVRAAEAQGAE